uniref:Lysine--tRNA ligase n=1 Tax=Candidatus Kentrum sp. SD TaxID=2126332 RepID=A0A450Y666_9GAMM|nr:MAG: lysyl-tRNA synthetase, class I [Candidatus Kentron sp. SD]VFK42098.1 MAG: lysyl-tRNA synthetase, class I [Candidatus Kentron sp. SD]
MWTTKLIDNLKPQYHVINDSKTPSGRVHVGSLRGVLIHDAIYRELRNRGLPGIYLYGIDDYDPMDGLPADAPDSARRHMGKPLCNIPAPEGSDATDMADHYISEFLGVFRELKVSARIYRMRDVYRSGFFNEAIDTILRNAHVVRGIYEDISGARRPDYWHPFQVICENCGKIGTTEVFAFDGQKVGYHCKPGLVTWAEGCDHRGEISPFDGNGKLPWKLEWAAKWHELGITIEGAGKDHCTKGGSRDVAGRILREVFDEGPPLNVPYEFFLVQGAKMSSSKGLGSSARDMADFLPPEILRFLMVRTDPKKAVNFSTDGAYMLKTFNEHDRLMERFAQGDATSDQIALLRAAESDDSPDLSGEASLEAYAPVSFQLITSLLQIPHVDLRAVIRARMGREPTDRENRHIEARIEAATYWLNNIAGEEDKFEIQETLPAIAEENSPAQQYFIARLGDRLPALNWEEDALRIAIFDTARLTPLPAKAAFEALYRLFLAKQDGPRAGALLSYLDRDFVMRRLKDPAPCSVLAFIESAGIPVDDFVTRIEAERSPASFGRITPEIYIKTPSEAALGDTEVRKRGFCVLEILMEEKGRLSAVRVILLAFARNASIDVIRAEFERAIAEFSMRVSENGWDAPAVALAETRIELELGEET